MFALRGRLTERLLRSNLGRRATARAVLESPDVALGALGWKLASTAAYAPRGWPVAAAGFEDVAPVVLSSNEANRGVASMSLVELAHLWRLVRESAPGTIVEIGRERGGSTFVLAAAVHPGSVVHSYDPQTKIGARYDDELRDALGRFGLSGNVRILLEDSHVAEPPEGDLALVLVDGDPSYEGTRLDFERFCRRLRPGGHALFHDAAPGGPRHPQLARLMDEIAADAEFERQPDVHTFAHFVRRPAP